MASVNDIRTSFLDFFKSKGHTVMASSPLVPQNDPTLMFTNAGMVQFKNVFTGAETPPQPPRAATSQKCVRAGGKHNDLDNVGYTARHHTFFEMLGNFSFGDYFKDEAISHAWELLTKDFGIDKSKLIVTVYHTDDEARALWRKIAGLSDDRIISIPTSDNFWSMGDTGPCGPCSEIFYDHGDHIWGGVPGSAEEDGDRWIEIWNLVFMQFERHAHMLGASEPLLHRLAPVLIQEMGGAYSELRRAEAFITSTLEQEEVRFRRTLGRGLSLLDEESAGLTQGQELSGKAAFQLYDTYGFPVDLTQDVLRARGIGVDMTAFNAAMDEQKALARAAWAGSGEAGTDAIWLTLKDEQGGSEFLGYSQSEASGQLAAIVVGGAKVDALTEGETGELVFNQTPFYAESGGQAGDQGVIRFDNGAVFEVEDTLKRAGAIHGHKGKLVQGGIKVGDAASLTIDAPRRNAIRANHSATHLMHAALQNVLGPHVTQKGSLVEADRLRFDFAHGAGLSRSEIDAIEAEVNAVVRQNTEASTRLMTPDEAIAEGAMALFGEKYGDEVRVLAMGRKLDHAPKSYSVELCGGTHVGRTGDIGSFVIVSEGAVAAGVRRIEAATGQAALDHLKAEAAIARAAAEPLKAQLPDLPARIEAMIADRKRLEKELTDAKQKLALGGGGGAAAAIEEINGVKLDARILAGIGAKDLRPMVNEAIQKLGDGVVAYVAAADGKAAIAVASTVASVSAVDLVKAAVLAMGGQGGGGKPDFAQGGAPTADAASAGLDAVKAAMAN